MNCRNADGVWLSTVTPSRCDQRVERLRVAAHVARDDDHAAAVEQRAPDLPDREVEGVRVEERPHVVRRRSRTTRPWR